MATGSAEIEGQHGTAQAACWVTSLSESVASAGTMPDLGDPVASVTSPGPNEYTLSVVVSIWVWVSADSIVTVMR